MSNSWDNYFWGRPPCFQPKCETCQFKDFCKNAKVTYTYGNTTWASGTGGNTS